MEGSNLISSCFNFVLTWWFNLGSSVGAVWKLVLKKITKDPFLAFKSILSNFFLYKNFIETLFLTILIFTYYVIYRCVFCFERNKVFTSSQKLKKKFQENIIKIGWTGFQDYSFNFNLRRQRALKCILHWQFYNWFLYI